MKKAALLGMATIALAMGITSVSAIAAEQKKQEKKQAKKEETQMVKEGSVVSIEYTLTDKKDGTVLDSNKGKEPLTFTANGTQIIPGLEKQIIGMKKGEEKKIEVAAKDAYGEIRDDLIMDVPIEKLPQGVKVGDILTATGANGSVVQCKVKEVNEKSAKLDMNHPLAGKDLVFDIKVVDVK